MVTLWQCPITKALLTLEGPAREIALPIIHLNAGADKASEEFLRIPTRNAS